MRKTIYTLIAAVMTVATANSQNFGTVEADFLSAASQVKLTSPALSSRAAADGVTITPAEGTLTELQSFTLTFSNATTVEVGNLGYGNAPHVLKDNDENQKTWCFNVEASGNTLTVGTSNPITVEGNYTLHVPAGFYLVDGVESTEEMTFEYVVAPAPATPAVTITPAEGTLTELQSFTLTFSNATTVEVGNLGYGNAPHVLKDNDENQKTWCFNVEASGNALTVGTSNPITVEGNYTLHVPAGFYLVDGVESTEEMTFEYVVAQPQGDASIISEAPAGTRVESQIWFLSYFVSQGSLFGSVLAGKPTHYILGDDGCLYLYNPIIIKPFDSKGVDAYIKGEPVDGKYVFNFPQPLYTDIVDGQEYTFYVNRLTLTESNNYAVATDDNSVTFVIREDGTCEPDPAINGDGESNTHCIGATNSEGSWNGFGNVSMSYRPFNHTLPSTPGDDVVINTWTMTYEQMTGSVGEYGQTQTKDLSIGIKDNDIWIKGLGDTYLPDAWAHGTIEGNIVTLDSYLGIAESVGQYAYLLELIEVETEVTEDNPDGLEPVFRQATFDYDADAQTLTLEGDLVLNPNEWYYYALKGYGIPVIKRETIEYTTKVPNAPRKIGNYHILDEATGKTTLTVYLNNDNVDGQLLNEANLFYQLMLPDGSIYVFDPANYSSITEPVTDVPYSTTSGIVVSGMNLFRNLNVWTPGFDNIGARAIYKDETGSYYSDITWYTELPASGIANLADDSEAVAVKWHDVCGREVANPTNGLFIQTTTYSSGKTVSRKVRLAR